MVYRPIGKRLKINSIGRNNSILVLDFFQIETKTSHDIYYIIYNIILYNAVCISR